MKTRTRVVSLYAMALLYFAAGLNHFINPGFYEKILPSYIPLHATCIFISGICEIGFAVLLLPERSRKTAAWFIIAMLSAFFIVHLQMLIDHTGSTDALFRISLIRIPVQLVLIWWAYFFTKNP